MSENYSLLGRRMFIMSWLIFFALLLVFFHYSQQQSSGSYEVNQGKLHINADEQGHYRVDGSINEHPVRFLIDTGATLVALPEKTAQDLGIRGRYPVTMETAKGKVSGSLTRIASLRFAHFHLQNVQAVIIDGSESDEILLGMNVLSKFNMEQIDDVLTIKSPNQ